MVDGRLLPKQIQEETIDVQTRQIHSLPSHYLEQLSSLSLAWLVRFTYKACLAVCLPPA
jgi:hypothetical protein